MHVNDWPLQLWEALIAHIDAKALLYSVCHGGTYNVRAFSSLAGETFFSELTLNDKRGQGTMTTEEFGQFVGNSIEQMQARLDPDRLLRCRNTFSHSGFLKLEFPCAYPNVPSGLTFLRKTSHIRDSYTPAFFTSNMLLEISIGWKRLVAIYANKGLRLAMHMISEK
ncbi:hypothetical protein MAR_005675 [Mya arenaria]|uniref:EF-hand domain-containing protein n=1 Tax=Mya arenaria TaxID=6604 RepID=A0ABY7F069_MYAAR|nr:hypothetical protein MAR_005675 [Mya arenaria]